jgi:hypothetical protein
LPPFIDRVAGAAIENWLTLHQEFRVIDDAECKCDDELKDIRTMTRGAWVADPSYHPYYVTGDFNGDGRIDLAVGVRRMGADAKFQVLIISGYRVARHGQNCAFLSQAFDVGEGLFFGPPRPKPYRLLEGPFDTDVGVTFSPRRGCH